MAGALRFLLLALLAGPLLAAGILNEPGDVKGAPVAAYAGVGKQQDKSEKSIISELSGQVYVDGSLRSSSFITPDKFFELVVASTPTAPTSGHARIWLNSQNTGKTAVKVIFEDGTIVSIANN